MRSNSKFVTTYIVTDSAVAGFGRVMSITVRNQFGFSHPSLDSQMLHIRRHSTTTVSGVITPAGSAQASGHAPRIVIPTYPWTLPVGEIDPSYRLVLSETELILPVCKHFVFISKLSGSFLGAARINSKRQLHTNQPDLLGKSGNTTQAKHS